MGHSALVVPVLKRFDFARVPKCVFGFGIRFPKRSASLASTEISAEVVNFLRTSLVTEWRSAAQDKKLF